MLVLLLHALDGIAGFHMITIVDVILAAVFATKPGVHPGFSVIHAQRNLLRR